MSRQELADAVNTYLHATTGQIYCMDANHIAKFELGEYRWPRRHYRQARFTGLRIQRPVGIGRLR